MNPLQQIVESNKDIATAIEALLLQSVKEGKSMETAIEALMVQAKALKDDDDTELAIKALIKLAKKNHVEMMEQMQRNDPPVESDFDMRLKGKGYIVIHGKDGEDGKDGKDGKDGEQGERGLKGEAGDDGDSAYQVWLKAGNKGSEADFLKAIKGDKGDRGERGFKGEKGDDGKDGADAEITDEVMDDIAERTLPKITDRITAEDLAKKINASEKPVIQMKSVIGLDEALKRYSGYQGGASTFLGLSDTIGTYRDKALQVLRVNATESGLETYTLVGGGDMLGANNLSDVADASTARTNLGLVIGTDIQAYSAVLANTTASFTTADETKLDGIEALADVTDAVNVGAVNAGATSKTPPVDADSFPIVDSEASNVIKRLTFTNLKAFLKTYFDTLYASVLGADDNYVTDAEKTKLSNLSGTNTGDETATTIGALIGGAGDATPNDTDYVATSLTASGVLKKITWTNVKAFLKTYFDTLYRASASSVTLAENTSIALDPAGSADGKYTGITVTGTAGYTQAFGDLVYLDPTDSRWELADSDVSTGVDGDPRGILGMVVSAGTDGTACTILLQGIIRADAKFPALTINGACYVGETAGAIQTTIPTGADNVIRVVGFALTADEIYFNPSSDHQITVA